MTKCTVASGLPEYFLYTDVASGEEVTYKIYICKHCMWATKTLDLAEMEIKVSNFFLTILSSHILTDRLVHSRKRVYA